MPTPQAYDILLKEHNALRKAAGELLLATDRTDEALWDALWDEVGDYEPDPEANLIPIPNDYAEQ